MSQIDITVARLVEQGFTRRRVLDEVNRRAAVTPDGDRAPGWWPGDPVNCPGCGLVVEQTHIECARRGHVCDVDCWDTPPCPDCQDGGQA